MHADFGPSTLLALVFLEFPQRFPSDLSLQLLPPLDVSPRQHVGDVEHWFPFLFISPINTHFSFHMSTSSRAPSTIYAYLPGVTRSNSCSHMLLALRSGRLISVCFQVGGRVRHHRVQSQERSIRHHGVQSREFSGGFADRKPPSERFDIKIRLPPIGSPPPGLGPVFPRPATSKIAAMQHWRRKHRVPTTMLLVRGPWVLLCTLVKSSARTTTDGLRNLHKETRRKAFRNSIFIFSGIKG